MFIALLNDKLCFYYVRTNLFHKFKNKYNLFSFSSGHDRDLSNLLQFRTKYYDCIN